MAYSKRAAFSKKSNSIAAFAKALSHPARIAILQVLAKRKECICGDIVSELPLAQSTVSRHLKELKAIGIIKGTIDGPKSCYCIDAVAFSRFGKQLNFLLEDIAKAEVKSCC